MREVTALVLTYNEQDNIARTLSSLQWIDRVVVLDSNSIDETVTIARGYSNVTIVQRLFDDHTSQWNFGLAQVHTPWVLTLDADYEVPPPFRDELLALKPDDQISGYSAAFQYRILGRPLRASVYPPRTVLFRRDRAEYVSDGHTQKLKIEGPVEKLTSPIFHDDRKPLTRWLASQDAYARLEANHVLRASAVDLKLQDKIRKLMFVAPIAMFFYLTFGRGLMFNGWPGCYYVAQRVVAELLLSLRLIEAKLRGRVGG